MNEFISVLSKIPNLIILDTYSAGEKLIKGSTSNDIYIKILKKNKNAIYLKNLNYLGKKLIKYTMTNNTIIFMGAGSISNIAKKYINN